MSFSVATIPQENLYIQSRLGQNNGEKVTFQNHEFRVMKNDDSESVIPSASLDKELRNISDQTFETMSKSGYFRLTANEGDSYQLHYYARGLGGGPVGAVGVFFATWGLGLAMCAAGTVLTATGVGAPAGLVLAAAGATTMGIAAPLAAAAVITPTP